ncbi:hypothetical protein NC653_034582 [Populus alba x Populus x berolinensis]|uniref:Uncharacterized protein n=1 Tax=Populus alba x Populus x berolinensis TaxID=444605 RepID=A0AAD6PWF5_9ROSI|nr:hypothetical protein NC653_034582 [Populus alba x Populus x berolinensis]
MRMVCREVICVYIQHSIYVLNIVHMVIHIQITSLGLQGQQAKLSAYFCAWIETSSLLVHHRPSSAQHLQHLIRGTKRTMLDIHPLELASLLQPMRDVAEIKPLCSPVTELVPNNAFPLRATVTVPPTLMLNFECYENTKLDNELDYRGHFFLSQIGIQYSWIWKK